jgi:AcrR family transcriptional regulator
MARTKIDRRIVKTKRAITVALLQLLSEKPLEEITITELTLKADINRKTFYLHYTGIEDVANELIAKGGELFEQALEYSIADGGVFIPAKFLECIHGKISEQPEIFRAFCLENTCTFFLRALSERCLTSLMNVYRNYTGASDASLRLCLSYMAHGVLNLYVDWVRNPSPLPLAEVTALAVRLVEQDTALLAGKQ